MENDWLAASSFELAHDVISAINTLSVHAKLVLAGLNDPAGKTEIKEAGERLLAFLDRFQASLQRAEKGEERAIMGTDPWTGKLALQFIAQKRSPTQKAGLYHISIEELSNLVKSESPKDLQALVDNLRELRSLIEQHSDADVTRILGEL